MITMALTISIGCAARQPQSLKLYPEQTAAIRDAKLAATPCINPAAANRWDGSNFRYGCFCGKNHPQLEHSSKKTLQSMTVDERYEFVAEYFRIEPWDDIDAACRDHDVCWILNGERIECNRELSRRLTGLKERFDQEWLRLNPEWYFKLFSTGALVRSELRNCGYLAEDIAKGFRMAVVPGNASNLSDAIISGAALLFSDILQHPYLREYPPPTQNNKCILHDPPVK